MAVDADIEIDAQQHRGRMAQREQADIERDMGQPVEKEDHCQQEQDVVETRHHVLGAEIDERQQVHAGDFLDVALVTLRHGVGEGIAGKAEPEKQARQEYCRAPAKRHGDRHAEREATDGAEQLGDVTDEQALELAPGEQDGVETLLHHAGGRRDVRVPYPAFVPGGLV
jgi:hypothetical protein